MIRRVFTTVLVTAAASVPAAAAPIRGQTLMPGVVYTRQVDFTAHGPVVVNIVSTPRPTGLYSVRAVLSNGVIPGRQRLSDMEQDVSSSTTVVGINGDFYNSRWGTPSGVLLHGGVLQKGTTGGRSAPGFDASGALHVDRVMLSGFWKGTGMYRPMGLNDPAGGSGTTLYTPAWGTATPTETGNVTEVVLSPFPAALPNRILSAPVVQTATAGQQAIPPGGAVIVARGSQAATLAAEAPSGTTVNVRLVLTPAWTGVLEATGGGPVLVRNGRPVFRSNESFASSQLFSRTARSAVGQTADGHLLLVTVDAGHRGYSTGMTNFELALAMMRLGAVNACALGTGAGATLAFDGKVLNRPYGRAETSIADALLIGYDGVYVPQPPATVTTAKVVTLTYKVVRRSSVSATLTGPDGSTVVLDSGTRAAGTYPLNWTATTLGRWTFTVTATDDLGRRTSADRTFTVGST
jgi:Phosphodiester glycosidase